MQSSALPLPRDVRWRRLFGVCLFLALLYLFRKLAPVLICYVILERALGWCAAEIEKRTRIHRKGAIALLLTVLAGCLGAAMFVAIRRLVPIVAVIRREGMSYFHGLFEHDSIVRLRQLTGLEGETLSSVVKEHAGVAIKYATGTAHLLLYVLIGLFLAIIYLFEREEIDRWYATVERSSVIGTLARWFGYLGDAIAVTVRMQAVVAVVNALVTLPILLFLRLHHIPLLFLLILISGLVPVVGNIISGAVLSYVAFTTHGLWAVAVFLGLTFVLHKVESYYLNPRLAAEHVKLPGLVLVISLLLFEQVFGVLGLFLSFPALYVTARIANEWQEPAGAGDVRGEASLLPPATGGRAGEGGSSVSSG